MRFPRYLTSCQTFTIDPLFSWKIRLGTAFEICMSCDNNFDCPPLIPSDIVRMLWAAHRSEDDRVLEIVEFVLQTRANISQGIELAEHHWKGFTG
jgi:hypothetical protein